MRLRMSSVEHMFHLYHVHMYIHLNNCAQVNENTCDSRVVMRSEAIGASSAIS